MNELYYQLYYILMSQQYEMLKQSSLNPLNKVELKCYSQNGEDGIIAEIVKRMALPSNSKFIEFGVGDGLECNSLQLLFRGWKGYWVDNADLAFNIKPSSRLKYFRSFITLENLNIIKSQIKSDNFDIDFLSMDFDGNDAYLVESLKELKPKIICTEYNASIVPPGLFCIDYKDDYVWSGDDCFGASLQFFVNLLPEYKLVCCCLTGANAFFVRNDFAHLFFDVPNEIQHIYKPPFYQLLHGGHPVSPKTIELIINKPDDYFLYSK